MREPKWGIVRDRDFFNMDDYEPLTAKYQEVIIEESLLLTLLRDAIFDYRGNFTRLSGHFRAIELLAGAGRVLRGIRASLINDDLVSAFLGKECGAAEFRENITQVDRIYEGDDLLSYQPRLWHDMTFLVHVLYLFPEDLWPKVIDRAIGWTKVNGLIFVMMRNDRSTGSAVLKQLGAREFGELNGFIEQVTKSAHLELVDRREVGYSRLVDETSLAWLLRYWMLDRNQSEFPSDRLPTWDTHEQLVTEYLQKPKIFANQELLIFRLNRRP